MPIQFNMKWIPFLRNYFVTPTHLMHDLRACMTLLHEFKGRENGSVSYPDMFRPDPDPGSLILIYFIDILEEKKFEEFQL